MHDLVPLVAISSFFVSLTVIAYLYLSSRHKIRMALIQHGQRAEIFKEDADANNALKWGMVAVGLGLGLFGGNIANSMGMQEEPAYFGLMLMFGGGGLILYYNLVKRKRATGREELV